MNTNKRAKPETESASPPTLSAAAKLLGSYDRLQMESDDDIAQTVFWLQVDAVNSALVETLMANVKSDANGYAVALEAVQELYQSMMAVPVISELEARGDETTIEKVLKG